MSAAALPAPAGPGPGPGEPAPSTTLPFTELTTRRLGPVRRFFVRHPVAMDVVVMAWFGVPSLGAALLPPRATGEGAGLPAVVWLCVAAVLGTTALFWRRRRPLTVAVAIGVLAVGALALGGTLNGFDLAVALVVYAVAASRPPGVSWALLVGLLLVVGGATWLWEDGGVQGGTLTSVAAAEQPTTADGTPGVTVDVGPPGDADLRIATMTSTLVLGLAGIAIGISVRNRRMHVADLVERANTLARDRDQQAVLARVSERGRIAREMHDVVAHSLSVMIALADGAGAALERSPDRSRAALDELSATGRSALGDMRRILGVLDVDDAPLEPQPGAPDLASLVERFRTAGLPVRASGTGTPLPDDAGLQLAVYRIVQESLTNVLRHAPGTAAVDLLVRRGPGEVEVVVADAGTSLPVPDAGGARRGLIGMTERATVYGGTVEAGPHGTGWRVRAVLRWRPGGGGQA